MRIKGLDLKERKDLSHVELYARYKVLVLILGSGEWWR